MDKLGKVVFTNGCFDILTLNHVRLLQKAKALGHFLIVGVNSDESVERLKGKNRPINNQYVRVEILKSLDCVDQVVVFEEDDPLCLIEEIRPHVLVKGGDYEGQNIIGADYVKSIGGEVVILPLEDFPTTTDIIKKIKNYYIGL